MTRDYDQMVGMGNQPSGYTLCRVSILSDSHCILPIFHQGMHRDNQGFERCPWCHIGTSSVPTTGPVTTQQGLYMDRQPIVLTGNQRANLRLLVREAILDYFKSLHIGLDTMDYQQLASTILHQISTLPTEDIPTTVEASTTTGNGVVPSQDGRWSVVSWPFYGDNANHSKRHFGLVSNKEGYHIALGDTDEAMARQHCEYLNGSV
jgi:hypothetical protein